MVVSLSVDHFTSYRPKPSIYFTSPPFALLLGYLLSQGHCWKRDKHWADCKGVSVKEGCSIFRGPWGTQREGVAVSLNESKGERKGGRGGEERSGQRDP